MGQATANLPDPLQDLSNTHAGGADDLLAQLAGDEIDRLLAESDVEPAAVAKAAPVPADASTTVAAPLPGAEPDAPAVHVDIPHPSEIAAVLEHSEPVPHEADTQPPVHHAASKTPLWLMPLMWINAPLDALPESLRDLVGKLAIATTANALAVLAYVALFRRHH